MAYFPSQVLHANNKLLYGTVFKNHTFYNNKFRKKKWNVSERISEKEKKTLLIECKSGMNEGNEQVIPKVHQYKKFCRRNNCGWDDENKVPLVLVFFGMYDR